MERAGHTNHPSWLPLGLALLAGTVASCAPGSGSLSYQKSCALPTDQVHTMVGRWKALPIPIAVHQGDWNASELTDIMTAITTWNTFYASTQGLAFLDYGGNSASPRVSNSPHPDPATVCSSGMVSDSGYQAPFVIYKSANWPYTSQPNAIAITSLCKGAGSPIPYFYMSMMDINYKSFFVQGTKVPDLTSIVLHELGHLAGMGHTCESGGTIGTGSTAVSVPDCSSPALNPIYKQASLYPTFDFYSDGMGIPRASLNSNDQGRANCLYKAGFTTDLRTGGTTN